MPKLKRKPATKPATPAKSKTVAGRIIDLQIEQVREQRRRREATPAKPTPGPYRLVKFDGGYTVRTAHADTDFTVTVFRGGAWSSRYQITNAIAKANAQAFIDGMAAIETLQRIRDVLKIGSIYIHRPVIAAILDEEPKS
jgi:hypothetical protein